MFKELKHKVNDKFQSFQKSGKTLFNMDYDRDDIWEAYLDNFSEDLKQEHNCNCCKAFLRQVGGVVVINDDLTVDTIWDLDGVPEEFKESVKALKKYILSLPISGLFYHFDHHAGTDKTPDKNKDVVWEHFYTKIGTKFKDTNGDKLRKSANIRDNKNVLQRALEEITDDAIETVKELIDQNSLYRGNTYLPQINSFKELQDKYNEVSDDNKNNFLWKTASVTHESVCKIRNSAIGTLLVDLSEGKELERSVKSFENMVAPHNYKRPTALVTPRMIESAKKTLEELDLLSALDRRRLDTRDLTVADALYVHRPTSKSKDVFAELAGETPVNPKTLSKVEEVNINDFIDKVLPKAKNVRVLMERNHLGNMVTLTGPSDSDANNLFKWDNSFGWSYTGGVADSIKERVKTAGGKVEGCWARFSLAWYNYDDLDIHFKRLSSPQSYVYFSNKRDHRLGVHLDVDMNISKDTREAVENIYAKDQLPAGDYEVFVQNYNKRESVDTGYELEIEINGELINLSSKTSPQNHSNGEKVKFKVDSQGNVTFSDNKLSKTSTGVSKWGVKTGVWHDVNAITLSPNHWTRPQGNKHWFFLLKGCVSDEKTRPFYNEFLIDKLSKDRKVSEVLANKIEVDEAEGVELSGLGFSETIRNYIYVEVESKFKRTIKVKF